MGYMGFGMQKWIYNQRPRRPFSKDRKPSGDTIPQNEREFVIRKHKTESSHKLNVAFAILLIVIVSILIAYGLNQTTDYTNEINVKIENTQKQKDEEIFAFLFNSAKQYSINGHWEKAKTDFELALKQKPQDLNANKYYIETLLVLCEKENRNCSLCRERINDMILNHSDDADLHKLKANLLLISGDTLSAAIEMEKAEQLLFAN